MRMTRDLPRGTKHSLRLPCINCRQPLPEPPWFIVFDSGQIVEDVAECPTCGIQYAGELLRTAHPEMWAYVMHRRLFCFECGDSLLPVLYNDDSGHVIPCPRHGAAPA